MGKLSKRTVDQATPQDADYFIWDDELPGFALDGEVVNASPDAGLIEAPGGEFGLTQRPTPENPSAMSGCER